MIRSIPKLGAIAILVMAVWFVGAGAAHAGDEVSCDTIIATYEEGGGAVSAEQVAAKLKTTEERVRECMRTKDANPPDKPAAPAE